MSGAPRPRGRRGTAVLAALAMPLGVGTAVLIGCLVLEMVPRDAAAAALTAFGVALALRTLDKGEDHPWPDAADRDTDGSRRDVSRLSWSLFGRDGAVSEAAVRRLRQDALRRLARVGVVLPAGFPAAPGSGRPGNPPGAEDRARALLGEPVWQVLTAPGGRLPDLADVERCVDAIERLVPPAGPDGRTTT